MEKEEIYASVNDVSYYYAVSVGLVKRQTIQISPSYDISASEI